jgi:PD-(D/E)XK nuclease superfamily
VHVGRLDMEIAQSTILELKVAPRITPADRAQLMKYVRAKRACGMRLEHAAVVCFREDGTVEISEADLGAE